MVNGVVEIVGVVQHDCWWSSFARVVVLLMMVFVMISTFPPPSGVPAPGATTCWMWVVHRRACVDVVSEWLKEEKVKGVCHLFANCKPTG